MVSLVAQSGSNAAADSPGSPGNGQVPDDMPASQISGSSQPKAPVAAWRPLLSRTAALLLLASFPALGLVPVRDTAFAVLFSAYLILVNRFRFDSNARFRSTPAAPLVPWQGVRQYAAWAGLLAVLAPVAVLLWTNFVSGAPKALRLDAFVQHFDLAWVGELGSGQGVSWLESWSDWAKVDTLTAQVNKMLAPHLFLVMSQIFMEYVSVVFNMAMLVRILVPIGFNAYRLWVLAEWCSKASEFGVGHMALAYSNLAFWTFNLFGFLLLYMLPLYLDKEQGTV